MINSYGSFYALKSFGFLTAGRAERVYESCGIGTYVNSCLISVVTILCDFFFFFNVVDFSGLYKNIKSCFFKLEAKILIICYRISLQVNLMSHAWETHHPGCRQPNRGWLLCGHGAARGKGKSCRTLCYVIIKPLNPSNWQLLSRTRGMVIFVGKHASFFLPSFLYQEGFTAFAAGLEKGSVWSCCR